MPIIQKSKILLDNVEFIGYDKIKLKDKANKNKFVHFFLDDYKFEAMYNNPEPRLEKLKQYKGVLTPQYSTYVEMPLAVQVFNIFRSRWVGAYLQSKGITVIPTVYWGEPSSYWFCFDGIEKGSTVAVSTLGVRRQKDLFMQGYEEMLRRIEPEAVICYNTPFPEMKGNVIEVDYQETNNLQENKAYSGGSLQKWTSGYVVKSEEYSEKSLVHQKFFGGYVVTAGMGRAGGGGGNRRGRDYVKIRGNKRANKVARDLGYDDAHDLKSSIVGKDNQSHFDIIYDKNTGDYLLIGKDGMIIPID